MSFVPVCLGTKGSGLKPGVQNVVYLFPSTAELLNFKKKIVKFTQKAPSASKQDRMVICALLLLFKSFFNFTALQDNKSSCLMLFMFLARYISHYSSCYPFFWLTTSQPRSFTAHCQLTRCQCWLANRGYFAKVTQFSQGGNNALGQILHWLTPPHFSKPFPYPCISENKVLGEIIHNNIWLCYSFNISFRRETLGWIFICLYKTWPNFHLWWGPILMTHRDN